MLRGLGYFIGFVVLTLLTHLGGFALLVALAFNRRVLVFVVAYTAISASALFIAPMFGRVPLPCRGDGTLQMQSYAFCALSRQYVVPELHDVLVTFATEMGQDFEGTKTRVLDANFPFLSGFPLLPHLSHHDGRKVDLAFYYEQDGRYLPGVARSPLGYFAFEQGVSTCPEVALTLRWDLDWLQPWWPDYRPDPQRMQVALTRLANDARVAKVFIEPHLQRRFGVQSDKIRFQGCRAARHDDHIHIQL